MGTHLFDGRKFLPPDSVLLTNEQGVVLDIVTEMEAGDGIERMDGILAPGFINCHCHTELSYLKGQIPEGTGMVDFLLSVIKARNASREWVIEAAREAIQAMETAGIVAVGDICNTDIPAAYAADSSLRFHHFIEVAGTIASVARDRYDDGLRIKERFDRNPASIVPHAPYSVSPELLRLMKDGIQSIHNQESAAENELFLAGSGEFLRLYAALGLPLPSFIGQGLNSLPAIMPHLAPRPTIFVHNVATEPEDMEELTLWANRNRTSFFWCLCPAANRYINGSSPPGHLLEDKERLVLGTDSLASNHRLDILAEIDVLLDAHPSLDTAMLLQAATSNGARALGMDEQLGSFEKGKRPGIVHIATIDGLSLKKSTARRVL